MFVNESPETIARIVLDAGLDVAQLHGTSDARGVRIWRACQPLDPVSRCALRGRGGGADRLYRPTEYPAAAARPGTGLKRPELAQKIILAGGLDADNVRTAIEQAQPWGVDACSRIEKSPGMKDHEKMRKFVKAALESR